MKPKLIFFSFFSLLLFALCATSCNDKEKYGYSEEYVKAVIEKSFDFKTTYNCSVSIKYDRQVFFKLYENEPTDNSTEEPFYTSFTDENGVLNSQMDIPKYLKGKTIYIYTDGFCVPSLATGIIGENGLQADVTWEAQKGRSSRGNAVNNGTTPIADEVISGIELSLPEGGNNKGKYPYTNANVNVTEKCYIDLIFIHENTSGHNRIEYFFYKTEDYSKINSSNIDECIDFNAGGIAFDDACYEDGLRSGATVRLQYKGNDTIPAGISIGWRVKQPKVNGPYFYSIPQLNENNNNHCVILQSTTAEMLIFGFEDWNSGSGWDMNDVLFSVKANPFTAIDNPDVPDVEVPTEVLQSESKTGTLLFEDLYPGQGDYDMNDVVVKYTLTKNFNKAGNYLRSLDIEIEPVHDGALYTNGFAFLIDNFKYNQITLNGSPTTLDEGNAIIVYNDNKSALNQTFKIHITTTDFNLNKDNLSWDAFNPFIFVGDRSAGVEVHLAKRAASGLVNSGNVSELVKQYLSHKMIFDNMMQWPFAMDIPTGHYPIVKESIRINIAYPQFEEWVKGFTAGSNYDIQWWNSPNPDYVY